VSDWKSEYKNLDKKSPKKAKSPVGKVCSVCLVYRQGETNLEGRYSLDGTGVLVCDKCLETILHMKFEHPEETEGQQWNWEPIKQRLGIK
jgi:hypothetical protein